MKRKELLYISVCIFLTIIAWVMAELVHTLNQKNEDTIIADPVLLQYKIDPNVFKLIENKNQK